VEKLEVQNEETSIQGCQEAQGVRGREVFRGDEKPSREGEGGKGTKPEGRRRTIERKEGNEKKKVF